MTVKRVSAIGSALTFAVAAVTALSLGTLRLAAQAPQADESTASPDDSSVVQVETLEIEPTVAKTGDLIRQTYRVRFPDLVGEGGEIIILEDRMAPESLPVHPFEGVALEIRKRQVDDEHVWDFAYDFRLIAPEKAVIQLPGFSFYYLVRDLGQEIEDAEVQQVDGGGGMVRYVTTMADLPVLDIRDTIELGSFQARATFFRTVAWAVAPLPLLVWAVLLLRHIRRPKTISEDALREADELDRIEAQIPVPPSIWTARRNLARQLSRLDALPPSSNGATLHDVQRGLVIAIREYIQAEIPELHSGDTPRDMLTHIERMKNGARKDALLTIASQLVASQRGLEQDSPTPIDDPPGEARRLTASLGQLRPHKRLFHSVTGLFGAR